MIHLKRFHVDLLTMPGLYAEIRGDDELVLEIDDLSQEMVRKLGRLQKSPAKFMSNGSRK